MCYYYFRVIVRQKLSLAVWLPPARGAAFFISLNFTAERQSGLETGLTSEIFAENRCRPAVANIFYRRRHSASSFASLERFIWE